MFTASFSRASLILGLWVIGWPSPVWSAVPLPNIVLNEVAARGSHFNFRGNVSDWVELHNRTGTPINISGLSLTDTTNSPRKWVFPSGSVIPGRGYKIILCDADRPNSATNTSFNLRAEGEGIYLFDRPQSGGKMVDGIEFGWQIPGRTIGRIPNATGIWALNQPTPGAANVAAPVGPPMGLYINEWMANPQSGDDYIEIFNPGPLPVPMDGMYLTDEIDRPNKHRIPPLTFVGTGHDAFTLFLADGTNIGNHLDFQLAAAGELIALYTPMGVLMDGINFSAQDVGVSEGRFPDGSTEVIRFAKTPSPQSENYLPLTNVVISEFLTSSADPQEDAIELQNLLEEAIDISGWYLSDTRGAIRKFQIPPGTIIEPRGFTVFYENQFNASPPTAMSLALDRLGDEIHLVATDLAGNFTGFRDSVTFGAAPQSISIGRHLNSLGEPSYVLLSSATFGAIAPRTREEFRLGKGAPNAPPLAWPVVINEVMFAPVDEVGTDVLFEYIELYNHSSQTVRLFDPAFPGNRWQLRNAADFIFPGDVSLPPRTSLLVVPFDPQNNPNALAAFRARYGNGATLFGPYIGNLDNFGDTIELYRPEEPILTPGPDYGMTPYVLIEAVSYLDRAPWPPVSSELGTSLQRLNPTAFGNDPASWIAVPPTPGQLTRPDNDVDGIPDEWEVKYELNPNDPSDAELDFDVDGLTNREEFLGGTDPLDAASSLTLLIAREADAIRLRFPAQAGKVYRLESNISTDPQGWILFRQIPAAAEMRMIEIYPPQPTETRYQFFRVVKP